MDDMNVHIDEQVIEGGPQLSEAVESALEKADLGLPRWQLGAIAWAVTPSLDASISPPRRGQEG